MPEGPRGHLRNVFNPNGPEAAAIRAQQIATGEIHEIERPSLPTPSQLLEQVIHSVDPHDMRHGSAANMLLTTPAGKQIRVRIGTYTPELSVGPLAFDRRHVGERKRPFILNLNNPLPTKYALVVEEASSQKPGIARKLGIELHSRRKETIAETPEEIDSALRNTGLEPAEVTGLALYSLVAHGKQIDPDILFQAADMQIPGVVKVKTNNTEYITVRNGSTGYSVDREGQVLRMIPDSERLVMNDYQITPEVVSNAVMRCAQQDFSTEVYHYPELSDRLHWTQEQIEDWAARGMPLVELVGDHETGLINAHSERQLPLALKIGDTYDFKTGQIRNSKGEVIPTSEALHPQWQRMLREGVAIPGFGYNWVHAARAVDGAVLYVGKDGFLYNFSIQRADTGQNATVGGFFDARDPNMLSAIIREMGEETSFDPSALPRVENVYDGPAADPRDTLFGARETNLTVFLPTSKQRNEMLDALASGQAKAGDDARKIHLMKLSRDNIDAMFAMHPELMRLAVRTWQEQTGLVVDKEGQVGLPLEISTTESTQSVLDREVQDMHMLLGVDEDVARQIVTEIASGNIHIPGQLHNTLNLLGLQVESSYLQGLLQQLTLSDAVAVARRQMERLGIHISGATDSQNYQEMLSQIFPGVDLAIEGSGTSSLSDADLDILGASSFLVHTDWLRDHNHPTSPVSNKSYTELMGNVWGVEHNSELANAHPELVFGYLEVWRNLQLLRLEATLASYRTNVASFLLDRGINSRYAHELSRLAIESSSRGAPAPDDENLRSMGLSPDDRARLANVNPPIELGEILPSILVGNSHHEFWKVDFHKTHPGENARWKVVTNGDDAEKNKEWIHRMSELEAQSGGLPEYVRRDGDKWEVNLLDMNFDQMPPTRQDENIASAVVAIRSVQEAILAGRQDELSLYQTALADAIYHDNFAAITTTETAGIHILGERNHAEWLRRNEGTDNVNYLTRQSYQDMLHIANGEYGELSSSVLQQVLDGASQDRALMAKVAELSGGDSEASQLRSVLTQYAQQAILETIGHWIIPTFTALLSGSSQAMVLEDLKFVFFALQGRLNRQGV